jgi:hypothetical protein
MAEEKKRLPYHKLITQMVKEDPSENAGTLAELCARDPHNPLDALKELIPVFENAHSVISSLNKELDERTQKLLGKNKPALGLSFKMMLNEGVLRSIEKCLPVLQEQLAEYPLCDACGFRGEKGSKYCTQCGKPLKEPADEEAPKEGEAPG